MKEILSYEGVTFKRGGKEILKGVDWKIQEGENWILLGLNGSGKSTLLGMIPAYTYPTFGQVRVFGHSYGKYEWAKIKKRVGFVSSTMKEFQSTLNRQSIEKIVLSGKFSSIGLYEEVSSEDHKKAEKWMKAFGILKLRDDRYGLCSQGEQRRALIARAFMNQPDLMVLDEPCSGLDLAAREDLLRSLNENHGKASAPLLYVTHAIEEIIPAITHVAIMSQGKITLKGAKKEILTEENLSKIYGQKIQIEWIEERPWIKVLW